MCVTKCMDVNGKPLLGCVSDVKPDQLGNSKTQKKNRTKNSLQTGSPNGGTDSATPQSYALTLTSILIYIN